MGRPRTKNRDLPPRMHRKAGRYYYVSMVDGKSKWIPLGDNYTVALAKWAELEGKQLSGETVADAINRYTAQILPELAKATQDVRALQLAQLRKIFGDTPLDAVRPMHIARYLDERGKPVAANREISLLATVYAYAMRWGWCDTNPCRGVRRNTERARDRYITDDEYRRLHDAADLQWKCIIELAYMTALRRGDLMRMQLSDIAADALLIRHGKTGARQRYELNAELAALIERIKKLRRRVSTVLLFATRNGQPYTESGWETAWRRIRERAEVTDCHFHDLRAKALTDAKRLQGRDYAQALAAHASGEMTETYIRARDTINVVPLPGLKGNNREF